MKDKWLVTVEIDTYDGDPKAWDWTVAALRQANVVKVISSDFKGRVLWEEKTMCDVCQREGLPHGMSMCNQCATEEESK
jgi:hypothetical protein